MIWGNFLHFYQPSEQKPEVLEAIVNQCYRPMLKAVASSTNARITANFSGCLLDLFDINGYHDLLDLIKNAISSGTLELVGSAKYHALLPLLTKNDIYRQIVSNQDTLQFYLGRTVRISGFFPPEMAVDSKVLSVLNELSFKYVLLDEVSVQKTSELSSNVLFKDKISGLTILPRHRRLSNLIMSSIVRNKTSFYDSVHEEISTGGYYISAMDAETFGHHRPGLENLLFSLIKETKMYQQMNLSDICSQKFPLEFVNVFPSTWSSSREDLEQGIQFKSWQDPENSIHKLQHKLYFIARTELSRLESSSVSKLSMRKARNKYDISLASDHYWWASAKPWWSVEMIELGANRFLDAIWATKPSKKIMTKAHSIYNRIIATAFDWQRSGKVSAYQKGKTTVRIPFKVRTLGAGGSEAGIYEAFIAMMRGLEKKAAAVGEYERAILWRDAIYKIEKNLDIFDSINAIDLVRNYIPNSKVEKILDKYTAKYKRIRSGQPEQRD